MEKKDKTILIDADVVSHFITAGEEEQLNKIFPGIPIHLLDKVHKELQDWPDNEIRTRISLIISKKIVKLVSFPEENEDIKKEYAWIKSMLFKGDGESACLAIARYNKRILASSNLKDIRNYCGMHKIDYLTTMDFLCRALSSGLFDERRCDAFIEKVKKKSKLPVKQMKDYTCRSLLFMDDYKS